MKPKAYVETTVVSYLTARPSRDLILAARQQLTREWWEKCRDRLDLVTSIYAVQEATIGNPTAAEERLRVLATMPLLEINDVALALAEDLLRAGGLPEKARIDALHIAAAVTNGVEYLVTWNLTHLANPMMRRQIDARCRAAGFDPVIICTPEALLGE